MSVAESLFQSKDCEKKAKSFNLFIIPRSGKRDRADAGEELSKGANCKKCLGSTIGRILVKGKSCPKERFGSKEEHVGGNKKPV